MSAGDKTICFHKRKGMKIFINDTETNKNLNALYM